VIKDANGVIVAELYSWHLADFIVSRVNESEDEP